MVISSLTKFLFSAILLLFFPMMKYIYADEVIQRGDEYNKCSILLFFAKKKKKFVLYHRTLTIRALIGSIVVFSP